MQKSRIILTKPELDFAASPEYPLMKHQIMESQANIFTQLGQNMIKEMGVFEGMHFKISRGENYKHMPWMVLDLPAISGQQFAFTCRTLFWWGNYYSINLILRKDLLKSKSTQLRKEVWMECEGDLWNNDLNSGYVKTNLISKSKIKGEYLRISQSHAIEKYDKLGMECKKYGEWLEILMK